MIEIREYLTEDEKSPFAEWFGELPAVSAAKVSVALARMRLGNISNVKSVGEGVSEWRINFGPGYRLYFGRDGDVLIILLAGSEKSNQHKAVEKAKKYWKSYKDRKKVK